MNTIATYYEFTEDFGQFKKGDQCLVKPVDNHMHLEIDGQVYRLPKRRFLELIIKGVVVLRVEVLDFPKFIAVDPVEEGLYYG